MKLGLIGGMGPQSTVPYYLNIVYGVQAQVSKPYFPNIVIESLNLFEILEMIENNDYESLTGCLLEAIERLALAGAETVALTANTAHIVFDRLTELSPVPLVSIIDALASEIRRRNIHKVGLLGTVFTMEGDFFKEPLTKSGIDVVIPQKEERIFINEKIYGELEYGKINTSTQRRFVEITERMVRDEGLEAIILGCTELPLVLNDAVCPVPCLDTLKIHCDELVRRILAS